MRVILPSCGFCGELYESEDDVNTTKSFCTNCSETRSALAGWAFHDRRVVLVAGDSYIVSKRIEKKNFRGKI